MCCRKEKRDVYMLTSFIAAHQHAQNKIHEFLVLDDDQAASSSSSSTAISPGTAGSTPDDSYESSRSPEERLVISESGEAVLAATRLLEGMNRVSVAQIRSKQVIALVLTKEAELVKSMVNEGLLTAKVYLPTYIILYLPTYLPTYLHHPLPTYLHHPLPTYLPTYLLTYLMCAVEKTHDSAPLPSHTVSMPDHHHQSPSHYIYASPSPPSIIITMTLPLFGSTRRSSWRR